MPNQIQSLNHKPAVEWYIANGYILFPLIGKIPPKGFRWSKAEYDPLTSAEDFPGNYGIRLMPDDLVIDIDPRHFEKDINPLEAFQTAINYRLKAVTFTVKTGGGGIHLYFKKDPSCAIRGALKEYPGLEFKSVGQYVVGAGSTHPDTNRPYIIACDLPVAAAPLGLLNLLAKVEVPPQPGLTHYVSDEQTKTRFIQYLQTAPLAVEGEAGDNTTFIVCAVAHDFGLHPDVALELMIQYYNPQCLPPWDPEALRKKVYNAYRYSVQPVGTKSAIDKFTPAIIPPGVHVLRTDSYGKIQKNVFNTVTLFNIDMPDLLSLNLWNEDIIFTKPAPWHRQGEKVACWTDEETARCKYYFGSERKYEPNTNTIEEAIITLARQRPFHPVKDSIESIKWDGISRLKDWMIKYLGVEDNVYTRAVGLKALVAAITRIYIPGHKFDYIPVLEGAQGIGKSRALAVLGGEWYGDITVDVHNKDTVDIMRRLWIIEVSEMETQYRTETQALKSFLSRSSDICRLAYGRRSKIFPRQNIFVGTINPEYDEDAGYLKDTTGNRRYWPVRCGKINIDALKKVRDQLWAEAYLYYKEHTALHFEDVLIEEQAMREQIKRMGTDPWYAKIIQWLDMEPNRIREWFTGMEIYCDCLGGKAVMYSRVCQNRIALIMRGLAWEKTVVYDKDKKEVTRCYRRPL